jgi:hypothetical protein
VGDGCDNHLRTTSTNVSDGVTGATDFFDCKGADAMIYPQVITDIMTHELSSGEMGLIELEP